MVLRKMKELVFANPHRYKTPPIEYVMPPFLIDGVEIVRYGWIRAGDINHLYQNFGRKLGRIVESHALKFKKVFNLGPYNVSNPEGYNPFHNMPIVIEENGELSCGRHRLKGALLSETGKDTLVWVCVVKFKNTRIKKQYQIKENLNHGPSLEGDEEDIIDNILGACTDGDCNKNASAIRQYLNEIAPNIKNKQKIIDKVLKEVDSNYETQEVPDRDEIQTYLEEEMGVDLSTMNWLIYTLRGGKGESAGDRKARLLKNITPKIVSGKDVNVVVSFSDTSSNMLTATRLHTKNEMINEYIEKCCEVADAFREGRLGKVYFNFVRQTKAEQDSGDFFVEVN